MTELARTPVFTIVEGAIYLYTAKEPANRKGHRYRVVKKDVLSVPDYAHRVLVKCLSGPDEGLWFTTSPVNFSQRYERETP